MIAPPKALEVEVTFMLADKERAKDLGLPATGPWSAALPSTFVVPESSLMSEDTVTAAIGSRSEFFLGDTVSMVKDPIQIGAKIALQTQALPNGLYRVNFSVDWTQLLGVQLNGAVYNASTQKSLSRGYHVVPKQGQVAIKVGRQVPVQGYVPGDASRLTKYAFSPRDQEPKDIVLVLSLGQPFTPQPASNRTSKNPVLPRPIAGG